MPKQLTDEEIALRQQAAHVGLKAETARAILLEREAERSYQFHVALRILTGGATTDAQAAMRMAGELIALDKEEDNG